MPVLQAWPPFGTKPSRGRFLDPRLYSGAQGAWILGEGEGAASRDWSQRGSDLDFVGAPAWQGGPLGAQLGGFTAGNYARCDAIAWAFNGFPRWMAVCFATTSGATGALLSLGNNVNGNGVAVLWVNRTTSGSGGGWVSMTLRGHNEGAAFYGPQANIGIARLADGRPHTLAVVSYSASDHRILFDGDEVGSSAATHAFTTFNQFSLGVFRRPGVSDPFAGSILAAAAGQGDVPAVGDLSSRWTRGDWGLLAPAAATWALEGTPPESTGTAARFHYYRLRRGA